MKSFNLLYTLENFAILTLTSSEEGESAVTAVENIKRDAFWTQCQ